MPILELAESPAPLEVGDTNLVMKAVSLFMREVLGRVKGIKIRLRKRIPLEAGMGGGSSDAAATLVAMDHLFETNLGLEKLLEMAPYLGSDVAFFLLRGTALGRGRGEILTPLEPGPPLSLVLVKPSRGLSTPDVYRSGKAVMTDGKRADSFQKILSVGKPEKIAQNLFNGLEPAALSLMPEIGEIKKALADAGALGTLVSGSGPTVFGVARDHGDAEKMAARLQRNGWSVFTAQTLSTGIEWI